MSRLEIQSSIDNIYMRVMDYALKLSKSSVLKLAI